MTSLDLSRLRQTAEAATPGPWQVFASDNGVEVWVIDQDEWIAGVNFLNEGSDAEFIATFDPVLVLELLNRIEAAEKDVEKARIITEDLAARHVALRGSIRALANDQIRNTAMREQVLALLADKQDTPKV